MLLTKRHVKRVLEEVFNNFPSKPHHFGLCAEIASIHKRAEQEKDLFTVEACLHIVARIGKSMPDDGYLEDWCDRNVGETYSNNSLHALRLQWVRYMLGEICWYGEFPNTLTILNLNVEDKESVPCIKNYSTYF